MGAPDQCSGLGGPAGGRLSAPRPQVPCCWVCLPSLSVTGISISLPPSLSHLCHLTASASLSFPSPRDSISVPLPLSSLSPVLFQQESLLHLCLPCTHPVSPHVPLSRPLTSALSPGPPSPLRSSPPLRCFFLVSPLPQGVSREWAGAGSQLGCGVRLTHSVRGVY